MIAPHAPSRRELLLASGALFAWAYMPKLARAEGRDPRFLTIVLRGALDGLAAVAPVGDPDCFRPRSASRRSGQGRAGVSPRAHRRRPSRGSCRPKHRSDSTKT